MIVWGGDNPLNTGSRYDPVANSWSATSLVNVPDARYYHTAIWTGNQMIVWGGYTRVSISDRTVYEGNAGTTNANFTVSLSSAAGVAVTVNYTTANGTATSGSDYSSASGTLTIPAGDVTGVISVSVTGEVIQESDETFFVNLNNPTNSTLVDSQGLGMILNDDSDACITPDERIYLYSVTLDINNNPVLSFQDFNQPNEVTGYNIYRSATPAPAHDPAWILKASNIVDGDASLANIQWVDFSGDPGTFYYQVVAYNNVCSGVGPW